MIVYFLRFKIVVGRILFTLLFGLFTKTRKFGDIGMFANFVFPYIRNLLLYLYHNLPYETLKTNLAIFSFLVLQRVCEKLYRLTGNPSTGLIGRISDLLAINVSWDVSKTTCNPDYLALKRPGVLKP